MAVAATVLLEMETATEMVFTDGWISAATDAERRLPFAEVARTVFTQAIAIPAISEPQLESTRTYPPTNLLHIPDEAGRVSPYPTYPNSAHISVIEVDADTGVVKVLSYAGVDDCGTVVNPTLVEGQFLGAIAMGIGGALWEDLSYGRDGRPRTETFKQYLLPRAPDLPHIAIGSQVTPSPFTLLGTKGAGEGGVAGAVASLTNAVNDALRPLEVTVRKMPLSGPTILAAIRAGARR